MKTPNSNPPKIRLGHRIRISAIKAQAAKRPPGYVEHYLSLGVVDGNWLRITPENAAKIHRHYNPPGLGDYVAKLAKPIARIIDWIFDTNLEFCPACARRQAWLNALQITARMFDYMDYYSPCYPALQMRSVVPPHRCRATPAAKPQRKCGCPAAATNLTSARPNA